MADLIDAQTLRQTGASALVLLQEAVGRVLPYDEAVERWDAMTPYQRRRTLATFSRLYGKGTYTLLDSQFVVMGNPN